MAIFLYNTFLLLYRVGIRIASLWNDKARLWLDGRKNIFDELRSQVSEIVEVEGSMRSQIIWIHCSSLGEFEQGRPLIENVRSQFPKTKILLTFFSPSGFEIRKNYQGADSVFYMPLDSLANAREFFNILSPSLVIFVKYDYWYYYLAECKKREIPLIMVSAIFRNEQPFFKWYGGFNRRMLSFFTHFFVQDKKSEQLLLGINIKNVTVAGDTRFDRVVKIAEKSQTIDEIERFCNASRVLVAGSTWPDDEKLIMEAIDELPGLKLIIAPHEIHKAHIEQVRSIFPNAIPYSNYSFDQSPSATCIIIDNIGMLSRLYHYATVTYVGGGFNKGIHNTLEAAVHGKPVIFGPKYEKFKEAIDLIQCGGGVSVSSAIELSLHLKKLFNCENELNSRSQQAREFVIKNTGATERIINYIEENRLLTR